MVDMGKGEEEYHIHCTAQAADRATWDREMCLVSIGVLANSTHSNLLDIHWATGFLHTMPTSSLLRCPFHGLTKIVGCLTRPCARLVRVTKIPESTGICTAQRRLLRARIFPTGLGERPKQCKVKRATKTTARLGPVPFPQPLSLTLLFYPSPVLSHPISSSTWEPRCRARLRINGDICQKVAESSE